ncbi:hypothetical protein BHE74_00024032 [Ensete ventricosum]|uniref:Uncharacterized protein n=1 Tax=Ensete ventricosum TaxID=4639 RepID=A0A444CCF7_ENSVE|nr:hypothetical protein GW17_00054822 [Ensete ventricosum]RWW68436.1 hypothetical protein BHE74_00024032 [Ensete ventricosum]RZR73369.1 hypothetical protein BHM03_00023275 [Ensete ventricosum]
MRTGGCGVSSHSILLFDRSSTVSVVASPPNTLWVSPRVEQEPSGAPTGKKSHKERLTTVNTLLDVLKASLEELYQGQRRLLGVENSLEKAESRIEKVEYLINQLTEDTKDSV